MTRRDERKRLLAVARGDEPADTVIVGGRVLCVFTKEWREVDVAVAGGRIAGLGRYEGRETVDATGRFVVPGFVDAHMHFEVSRLLPDEYAALVLPQGTTTVVADPHELANVLGVDGVRWIADYCRDLLLEVQFMAPSTVPASPLESPRDALGADDVATLLRRGDFIGLAEMMNFPGVIEGDDGQLAMLEAAGARPIDGHAPGVLGPALQAYAAAGIRSDHEALTVAEGRERLQAGMWLLIREASMARNLDALLPLLAQYGPSRIAFCTDDREPDDLTDGINGMVRDAVAGGINAIDALIAATLSGAKCHGLHELGAIAPSRHADLLLLPDLERFVPELVLKRGRPITAGRDWRRPAIPPQVRETVRIAPLAADALAVDVRDVGVRIRAIGLIPDQIVTEARIFTPTLLEGRAVADPAQDLVKIAVVERHHRTGRIGLGFVHGSGLRRGALASTVAHDAHNIVTVGTADDDMLAAVRRLVDLQGGIVVVDAGRVVAECPLPIAGLMSDRPSAEVIAASRDCTAAARRLGWTGAAPFMTLSFLALSVIPELKITDRGLVDVVAATVVPLCV